MGKLDSVIAVINAHAQELKQPGVVSIRPSYKLVNGWPTQEPAIVVVISQRAANPALPASLDGIPLDIRQATDVEQLRFDDPDKYHAIAQQRAEFRGGAFPELIPNSGDDEASVEEPPGELMRGAVKKPQIAYTPAAVALTPVTGKIPLICHASPDRGWPTLKTFLSGVTKTLTVGLYDFTSAHILDTVTTSMTGKQSFELVLDHPAKNPTADQDDPATVAALTDALGVEFKQAWALVRMNKDVAKYIYPSAYHIKVAVRDSKSVWVSSGNWNNSNQPDMGPINTPAAGDQTQARKSDRDWHVVIGNAGIAAQFEAYIKHDYEVASAQADAERGAPALEIEVPDQFRSAAAGTFVFHPPLEITGETVTITPLLTPDPESYRPHMLDLIESAQEKLYIQLQYIHPAPDGVDADFKALVDAVIARIEAGVDVRLILSNWQTTQGWLERLQDAGVDFSKVKIQNGVHNKGFVVDGKKVALGSQNWSGDGVLRNRDASVIIENDKAAAYYEDLFIHDWQRIAKQSVTQ
jgi:hypothetical protein